MQRAVARRVSVFASSDDHRWPNGHNISSTRYDPHYTSVSLPAQHSHTGYPSQHMPFSSVHQQLQPKAKRARQRGSDDPPTRDTAHSRLCDCDMHTPHAQLTPPLRLMRRAICLQIPSRGNAESRRSWSGHSGGRLEVVPEGCDFYPLTHAVHTLPPSPLHSSGLAAVGKKTKGEAQMAGLGQALGLAQHITSRARVAPLYSTVQLY